MPDTRATCSFAADELICQFGETIVRRSVAPEDRQLWLQWIDQYESLRRHESASEKPSRSDGQLSLSRLGQAIFHWLNSDRFLERWLDSVVAPAILELRVSREDASSPFLAVPWELLTQPAEEPSHFRPPLAGMPRYQFCPVRRIGAVENDLPASPYRLSMVFMASSPTDVKPELNYDAEMSAVLEATTDLPIDLRFEESGELRQLAICVRQESSHNLPLDVLHLSCHGGDTDSGEQQVPALYLEDEFGHGDCVTVDRLQQELPHPLPRLAFLSACNSALSMSLAPQLVITGFPAVLGWAGSVLDHEATWFARELYGQLAQGHSLVRSLAAARLKLLTPSSDHPEPAHDWHLARLYLGPGGGGVLASGTQGRLPHPHQQHQAYLDASRSETRVAGPWESVGRRRETQTVLRALRPGTATRIGTVIHAIGRQGKSSLAYRLMTRLPHHKPVIMYGRFSARDLLLKIADAVSECRELIDECIQKHDAQPYALERTLKQILETHCETLQRDAEKRVLRAPLLLILDDFEQCLHPGTSLVDDQKSSRNEPAMRATVLTILRAFRAAHTESRVIVTCREQFTVEPPVPGQRDLAELLFPLPLPAMDLSERSRQLTARLAFYVKEQPLADLAQARLRADEIITLSSGNPGLQDHLTRLALADPPACDRVLTEMRHWYLRSGALSDPLIVQYFDKLALDSLYERLAPPEKQAVKVLADLCRLPIPESLVPGLLSHLDWAQRPDAIPPVLARLRALGILERRADLFDPDVAAAFVSALVTPDLNLLTVDQRRKLAGPLVQGLFSAWGGTAGRRRRLYELDQELLRLALLAGDLEVIDACAEDAVDGWSAHYRYRHAADVGRVAIEQLDQSGLDGVEPAVGLLNSVGDLFMQLGTDWDFTRTCFRRVVDRLDDPDLEQLLRDPEQLQSLKIALQRLADLDLRDGKPGVRTLYQRLMEIDQASLQQFGTSPESLRDVSVSLNKVGDVELTEGDRAAALERYRRSLQLREQIVEQFGASPESLRDVSVSLERVGDVELAEGDRAAALERYRRSLQLAEQVVEQFGASPESLRDVCVSLHRVGDVEQAEGDRAAALERYRRSLQLAEQIVEQFGASPQSLRDACASLQRVGDVEQAEGDRAAALERYRRSLQLAEQIVEQFGASPQSLRDVSVSLLRVGDVELAEGDRAAALERYRRSLQLAEQIVEQFGASPQSLRDVSISCERMGDVAARSEPPDLALAEEYYRRSLTNWDLMRERYGVLPDTLEGPWVPRVRLGMLLLQTGDPSGVELLVAAATDLQTVIENGWATPETMQKMEVVMGILKQLRGDDESES